MRTTLSIDNDVMIAARALAEQQRRTIGEIISDLARKSLVQCLSVNQRNGIRLLPVSNPRARVTLDHVNELRDEIA